MTSLPTDVIKLEDIDLIGYWLDSKFDNGLVGHEIGRNLLPKLLKSGSDDDFRRAVCIVEIVTRSKGEGKTLMDADELEELFKKNASDLGTRCGKSYPHLAVKAGIRTGYFRKRRQLQLYLALSGGRPCAKHQQA